MKILLDQRMNPLYKAAIEATEEAILDSLCMAEPMTGHSGHHAPAFPIERLPELLIQARPNHLAALVARRRFALG